MNSKIAILAIAGAFISAATALPTRAIEFGIDRAMSGRDPVCIANDLRPECAKDQKKSRGTTVFIENAVDPLKGPFFLDWNPASGGCFVVNERPVDRTITGGGPFERYEQAIAAAKTVKGCG
jgi:hypothetical protein